MNSAKTIETAPSDSGAARPAQPASRAVDPQLQQELQAYADALVSQLQGVWAGVWIAHNGVLELLAEAGAAPAALGPAMMARLARIRQPVGTNSFPVDPTCLDQPGLFRDGAPVFAAFPLLIEDQLEGVMAMFAQKPLPRTTLDTLTVVADDLARTVKRRRIDLPLSRPAPASGGQLSQATLAVIRQDDAGNITDWNLGAERLFGYSHSEALGRSTSLIVPADRRAEHASDAARVARGEEVLRPDTICRHKDGTLVEVDITIAPQRGLDGALLGAVIVACSLADAKERQQQYQQAQKMEAFGKLAGGIAHDFNNLLTVIAGYSEILMDRVDAADPMRDWAAEIHEASQRAQTLTRQLLAFSRKQMIEPRILDLNAVVCDTEKMLRRLIGEDILMTTIFAPNLPLIKIDPGQLQQVILNLSVNARDAMPKGGRLTIETDCVLFDESWTQLHQAVPSGRWVMLAISDTGIGMSPATQARLFQPHFTTKGPGKGTGLGLTTVHDIVQQNAGHIEVESERGQGATFRVLFPAVPSALPSQHSNPRLRMIPRGQETILLVEDDSSVRGFARHILESCGYTVLEASDGEAALHLAESYLHPIHLVVSDVVMPSLSGRALVERLTGLRPNLRVVFLSGYTDDAVTRHGIREGEFPFLQKPFTPFVLAQKVRHELDRPAA